MLLTLASRYLKHVDGDGGQPWMGIRPSFPDGLPAIGRVSHVPGLLYAFGHAHNGLTLSAITAQCIAALARGDRTPVDIAPLDLNRFSRAGVPPAVDHSSFQLQITTP
jgi:D-amino-acid dehydrogenase